ncbi:hypothetical protein CC53_gp180 [Rhizobium phage vB_RleS_L338C]|uniref:hypothetical protein n=1 Tax=Rhizobium phage vB_RleS_L338C TaxID=1414737 RepID=UPI0003D89E34|nr:hypothetical protein CC53_gp180 [Rhizobium phage vB_RleS_L338C]AHC30597.1 hypothetical protein L338C_180 [Rhizobium phage vB_RleS_L338C]QNH72126.1 hypothetical protein P11VFA_138 [Rhizobium phage P11VFA]
MCNCPRMKVGRDFVYLMKVMTHSSECAGIDNFIAELPDPVSLITLSQCDVSRWLTATSVSLYEQTGITNNRFVCQNAEGTVVLTPEGCEFVRDGLAKQALGQETAHAGPSHAIRDGRFHYVEGVH